MTKQFFPPKFRNQKEAQTRQQKQQQEQRQPQQQQRQQTNNTLNKSDSGPRNEEDVIITVVSTYAQAAKQGKSSKSTNQGSTLIGKQVRFNDPDVNQTYNILNGNRPLLNHSPSQNNFGTYNQGM